MVFVLAMHYLGMQPTRFREVLTLINPIEYIRVGDLPHSLGCNPNSWHND